MAATEKQILALMRAREARRLNSLNKKDTTKKSENKTDVTTAAGLSIDSEVWVKGLIAALHTRDVKHEGDVAACTKLADAVLTAFKERFK